MIWLFVLGFLIIAGLVAAAIVLAIRHHKARIAAFQAWAAQRGFTFVEKDHGLERTFRGFTPFGVGSGRKASFVLFGDHAGIPSTLFQYRYTTGSGKNQTTHTYRILAMRMPLDGRGLDIKREHFGHKLVDALGGEDIDFESDAFSRRFWVKCRDRRFAYDVITPRMQEWLMADGERHWQWHGDTLMIYDVGGLDLDDAEAMLALGAAFTGHLPRHRLAEASV